MGLTGPVPENIWKLMSAEDRQQIAHPNEPPKTRRTAEGAVARYVRRTERQEQNTLAGWLAIQEEHGLLVYDWNRPDRRTTNRKGMPDFRVYREDRFLLGEMKIQGAKLSPDQVEMGEKFLKCNTQAQVWNSADQAIRLIKHWLWTHWRLWNQEGFGGELSRTEPVEEVKP